MKNSKNSIVNKSFLIILTILLIPLLFPASPSIKADSITNKSKRGTWEDYGKLLASSVIVLKLEGLDGPFSHSYIDYQKLKTDNTLQKLLQSQQQKLNKTQPPSNHDQVLSFWINAYNFFTLVEVVEHMPDITSLKDIGWKNKKFKVAGKKYSLDHIEHQILRPLKEPRIHFAINCASVSCPSLKPIPFQSNKIDSQLNEVITNSFKNPLHLRIGKGFWDTGPNKILTTKLFRWFKQDFILKGKEPLRFILKYAPKRYKKYSEYSTSISYNWKLNNKENVIKHFQRLQKTSPDLKIKLF